MKFFNIDCHISVIYDIQHVFTSLGHTVDDWCLSGHHNIINKPYADITLCDGSKLTGCMHVDHKLCDKFYQTFKDQLDGYDGFIACYPVSYAMLYEKWGKPIIIVNCVRYEHPLTKDPELWNGLNEFLKRYHERGLLHLIANNKGDQYYTEYYTGIKPTWISSLCNYTQTSYTGAPSPVILIHSRIHMPDTYISVTNAGYKPAIFSQLCQRGESFSWKAISGCKAIVHIPYHNGSMTIFENYTSCIPMFFPSKELCKTLFKTNYMFNDLTFYHRLAMTEPVEHDNPNRLSNPDVFQKWLDTTDFYDPENMPHIIYFDSFYDLTMKIKTTNYEEVSKQMKIYNTVRLKTIYDSWNNVLSHLIQPEV
jgi:hypothetical protein